MSNIYGIRKIKESLYDNMRDDIFFINKELRDITLLNTKEKYRRIYSDFEDCQSGFSYIDEEEFGIHYIEIEIELIDKLEL